MPRCLVRIIVLLHVCLSVTIGSQALAAEPAIPSFWDARERLVKPDVTEITRLRFITTTDFPPFSFIDASGRLSGFHVDLARAICAQLGITDRCQIQALPWNEHAKALAEGEGEALLSGLAVSNENREKYAFSRPYLSFPARFVARQGEVMEPSRAALAGKTVGVINGSAHERMLRDYFPDAVVQGYEDFEAMLAAVQTGMTDLAFGDGMRMSFWLTESEAGDCCTFAGGPYLAPEYLGGGLAVAVPLDRPELKQALDYALHEIGTKGTFAELYLRYFPISFF
jgi:polar amino acid transport system substrate-binding protein